MKKIPARAALDFYVALGAQRSYQSVATKFSVSKRAVTALAKRDRWQERLSEFEAKAREESIEAMDDDRLRCLRDIQGKALDALKHLEFKSALEAANALVIAIQGERAIFGEPTDIRAFRIEHTGPSKEEVGDDGGHYEDAQQARPIS